MHTAAVERGISIQYCMALPSDLLASLRFPSVTNYRASLTNRGVKNCGVGGVLGFVGCAARTECRMGVHRTRGEANEFDLTEKLRPY